MTQQATGLELARMVATDRLDVRLSGVADEKRIPAGPLTRQLAEAIQRFRGRMAYTELSERLTQLGRPIPVLGLRRIEKCERRVDADDIVALARALGVPPILLLIPLGVEDTVELLPGQRVDTWRAYRWFSGEEQAPDAAEASAIVDLYRQHERHVKEWQSVDQRMSEYAGRATAADPVWRRLQESAEQGLRVVRDQIRRLDAIPPGLPRRLGFIDQSSENGKGRLFSDLEADDGDE